MGKLKFFFVIMAGILILIAIIIFSIEASTKSDSKQLRMLHVIFRHGARTPADTFPTDPHINETFYPIGWGQLTNKGKMDMYNLGRFLRKRYGTNLLGLTYSSNTFFAQSTDVDRTKCSVQLVNAGLWPPIGQQRWGDLDWQPIPVHAEPLEEDQLLLVRKSCPKYHKEFDNVFKSKEIQNKLLENEDLFDFLSEKTGKIVENFDDVQDIYSTLKAEEMFNLSLPDWTEGIYPDKMQDLVEFSFILNAYNDKLNRLKGGVLLKKMLMDWRGKMDGSIKTNFFLYGGHDSTITNLLNALKVWDKQIPSYGMTILIEFSKHLVTKQFGLEIFLRNSTELPPVQLKIPHCDTFCSISNFVQLTTEVVPENWEQECELDDKNFSVPPPKGP